MAHRLGTLASLVAVAVLGSGTASGVRSPQPGIDPSKEPLVASFSCYTTAPGDGYATPGFVLQILPGRRYRVPQGEGTFTIDATERVQTITWASGPLVNDIRSSALFADQGQWITNVTPAGAANDSECFQQGARDRAAQNRFRAKDPSAGSYPCVVEGTGMAGPTIEILPGRRYAVAGATGAFTVNILGKQGEDWSTIDFVDGPLGGELGFYTPDLETGLRSLDIALRPRLNCDVIVAPTPDPRYGAAAAPKRPKARAPLTGMYASFQVDVVGVCGGLCWTFRTFMPDGYVYTREPDRGRGDAACGRTLPNGLPVCERYVVKGKTIRIGEDAPVSFARGKGFIRVGARTYRLVAPLGPAARLSGSYRTSTILSAIPGQSTAAVFGVYRFTPAGRFTREGFAGATFSPPAGQPGVSVTVSAQNGSSGRYRVLGAANTIELRFDNGAVRREFAFVPFRSGRLPSPTLVHFGGSDYLPGG